MAKKPTKAQKKVAKVMREYGKGELHSGSKKGPVVKSRKQAIAIAMSEADRDTAHVQRHRQLGRQEQCYLRVPFGVRCEHFADLLEHGEIVVVVDGRVRLAVTVAVVAPEYRVARGLLCEQCTHPEEPQQ